MDATGLLTGPQIAQMLGVPPHRISYAIRTRGITPTAVVQRLPLYDRAAAERVKEALAQVGQHRRGISVEAQPEAVA